MMALALVVTGLLGIVTLYTRSLALNRDVIHQAIAAGLAAEGIEVVKNMLDAGIVEGQGWNLTDEVFEIQYDSRSPINLPPGQTMSARPLRFSSTNNTYSYDSSGVETSFKRTMRTAVRGSQNEEYQVNAIITWSVRGEEKTLNAEDHFFNWRRL
jgi:hypothetical protein